MKQGETTLVMAGAREAHGVITHLLTRNRNVVASLPEPERVFNALPVPTRTGPFSDTAALETWVQDNNVACVIDASHAFDSAVSNQIAQVCLGQNLRYVRVLRPAWKAAQRDHWSFYTSVRDAASAMPVNTRGFSNTGWASLPEFETFSGERLFLRQTHSPTNPPPLDFVEFVVGTPPFSQQSEEILFRELRISCLFCRNVGGAASMSKLYAARKLGLRVAMINRPPAPEGMPIVQTVAEALAWEANP